MYYVYVLKSRKDGKHYTGMTNNISRRLAQHNRGNNATPSTMTRGPFIVIHLESFPDRISARKREKFLKSGCGREFIKKKIPE